jgi:MerR family transcriptional regulator, light-induced transcriptional regulator
MASARGRYDRRMGSTGRVARDAGTPIAGVSERLGIPVPTIRSWERRYGFPAPARTVGRHRRYAEHEIEQLRDLRDLITRGFAPGEAVHRLGSSGDATAGDVLANETVDAVLGFDATGVESALDRAADELGLDEVSRSVLLPAMREIGARWKAGSCDIGHEHFGTEVVRAWLARRIASVPVSTRRDPVVLACGPNDLHTIGLEAFALVLALRGWPTRILGAMTPTESLVAAVHAVRARAATVTAQRSVTRAAAVGSIEAVAAIPGVGVFYAGNGFANPSLRRRIPGVFLGEDVVAGADLLGGELAEPLRRR